MADKRTALVVDDDAVTREILGLMLAGAGWTVTDAEDGEAALRGMAARAEAPALLLADLHMPGRCGTELAIALRAELVRLPGGRETVLLAMTATPGALHPEGYADVLIKPFDALVVEQAWRQAILVRSTLAAHTPGRRAEQQSGADPVLDEGVWQRLTASMPPAALRTLCTMALADAGERVRRMTVAADTGDDAVFRREAHELKGSCGMIGARRLSRLAAGAESRGVSGETGLDAVTVLPELLAELSSFRLMLEELDAAREHGR